MTLVTANLIDVGLADDNTRWDFRSVIRESDDGDSIVTDTVHRVTPVDGVLTVDLDPGYCEVYFKGRKYPITVPDSGPADLWPLLAVAAGVPPTTGAQAILAALQQFMEPVGLDLVTATSVEAARDVLDVPSTGELLSSVEPVDVEQADARYALAGQVGPVIDPTFSDPDRWANAEGEHTQDQAYITGGWSRMLTANGQDSRANKLVFTHDGFGNPVVVGLPPDTRVTVHVVIRKHASNTDTDALALRWRYIDSSGVDTALATTTINESSLSSAAWTEFTLTTDTTTAAGLYELSLGIGGAVTEGNRFYVGAVWVEFGTSTTSVADTIAKRDFTGNLYADNFISSAGSVSTSGGTLTLGIGNNRVQQLTGTSTHTVLLPTTSVTAGQDYIIINRSTQAVTVQSSGANTIATLPAGSSGIFVAQQSTPTTAAHWDGVVVVAGKALTVSNSVTIAGTDGSTYNLGAVKKSNIIRDTAAPNGISGGQSNITRVGTTGQNMTSQLLRLSYVTPGDDITINNLTAVTGNTAAGATPTLCRMGVYSVDPNDGDLTLVASTTNDTAIFASIATAYTKALDAPVNMVAGTTYVFAVLVVSGTTMPTLTGVACAPALSMLSPPVAGQLAAQTDLPSSITFGDIANSTLGVIYLHGT